MCRCHETAAVGPKEGHGQHAVPDLQPLHFAAETGHRAGALKPLGKCRWRLWEHCWHRLLLLGPAVGMGRHRCRREVPRRNRSMQHSPKRKYQHHCSRLWGLTVSFPRITGLGETPGKQPYSSARRRRAPRVGPSARPWQTRLATATARCLEIPYCGYRTDRMSRRGKCRAAKGTGSGTNAGLRVETIRGAGVHRRDGPPPVPDVLLR